MKSTYERLFQLQGKTAVVTGGLGILGRHFCAALAAHGANVAVIDVCPQKVAAYARQLHNEYETDCLGICCDVSSPEQVSRMVQQVKHHFGSIDILHNNAATKTKDLQKYFSPFEDYDLDTWREVMSVNIDGMFLVAQKVGKEMIKEGRGGSIIQTSSIYGLLGPDQRIYVGQNINTPAVYSASKAAVAGLTKYLATYWAKQGIRVNTLTPGGVMSEQNDDFQKNYARRTPQGRMAYPSELTGALIFLASDASTHVTGENIVVDGGLRAW